MEDARSTSQRYDDLPVPRASSAPGSALAHRRARATGARSSSSAAARRPAGLLERGRGIHPAQKERLLSPRLARALDGLTSWDAIEPIHSASRRALGAVASDLDDYVDLNLRLPELLLMRVDKMTMGVSLEGRVPFLDHKFVELAISIPDA